MKKILLYIDSMRFGGAQRVMSILANHFISNYDVILVNDISSDKNIKEYSIDKRVKRIFLDVHKMNKITKNFYRIMKLRKIIKDEKPDIVLSFLGNINIRMLLATIGMSIKKIVSVRNDPNREYGTGLKKFFIQILFLLADGYVFQTQDAASYFSKKIISKSKIIFNPVHEKFFQTKWIGDKKEIAVVGRLQSQKNPILALKAFERISKIFPDYKLVYYGDDELKSEIISISKQMELEDRVIIYGKATDIENKLAHSKLYVLSSNYEGMPNTLLEAMAVGIPVISTDCPCGGPKTIIQNKKQGILVPIDNSQTMAQAITSLLLNEKMMQKISLNEQLRAEQFRINVVMKQWKDFISGINK